MTALVGRTQLAGRGVFWMVVSTAFLAINDTAAKLLAADLPAGEIISVRALMSLVALLVMLRVVGYRRLPPIGNPWAQALYGGLLVVTLFLFTASLPYLPLSDAIVLVYSAPIFVTALAPRLMGEKVGWRRWAAVVAGFIGVALVMRPTADSFHWAVLLPFAGALTLGLRDILSRRLTATEDPLSMLSVLMFACFAGGLVTLPFGWALPDPTHWLLLAGSSLLFLFGHLAMIYAFRYAEAVVVSPFKYTAVVWGVVFGALVWGDLPDRWDLAGSLLIVASGLYILLRENRLKRLAREAA